MQYSPGYSVCGIQGPSLLDNAVCKKESNFLAVDNFQAIFQHSIPPFIIKLCTFIRNFRYVILESN